AIEDYAFFSNRLTQIASPDAVTAIGEGAIAGNRITALNIGGAVTKIGDGAFYNNELNRITIPDGIEEVGQRAFNNKPKANSFGKRVSYYDTNDQLIFSTDESFDSYYASQGKKSGTYVYADGVWSVGP
ncbi:MAG: leucine-rich repeat domain-containing protein, partial [Treponema sp.]|nr:leucine-rich repeat domain-containing protein [Treponema sp.]